jgi:hypothetical protein
MGKRIAIKGASGAGKSTLARELARILDLPCIELDALHHGPNWTEASAAELQGKVLGVLDDSRGWIVDGNYESKLGTLILDRADLIVWLDLGLATKLWRLAKRTTRRWYRQEELWNGNRETLLGVLWGGDGLFPWTLRAHFRYRRRWPALFVGRPVVRLRTAQEVDDWFLRFCAAARRPDGVTYPPAARSTSTT